MKHSSLLFSFLFLTSLAQAASDVSLKTGSEIRRLVEEASNDSRRPFVVAGEKLRSRHLIEQVYLLDEVKPVWSDGKGLTVSAIELLNTLQRADKEGLNPNDYHLALLSRMGAEITEDKSNRRPVTPLKFAHIDLLLTDAFLTYGRHLLIGRIDPDKIADDWRAHQRSADLIDIFQGSVRSGDTRAALKRLHPPHPQYARLRIAFDHYRTIERNGGWEAIEKGKSIKKDDRDPRLPLLRRRLAVEGDLSHDQVSESDLFDRPVERALISFQKRHGLDADGTLGISTLAQLNIPIHDRVRQIEVNMERCRWLPADLGSRYIAVNVADFTLDVVENGETSLSMKVVVGRKYRKSPVFSSTMTTVVLNPDWSVPVKIARSDLLEHIHEDPDYLKKEGFKVYANYEENAPEIDPSTVDWVNVASTTLPYRFRQDPGAKNALGRIKFLFPNEFNVYLHDTPSKSLFQRTVRDFSSGCIRIEKPIELASLLLHSNTGWTQERINSLLKTNREEVVNLKEPIQVHLLYWTAWMDKRGKVNFRDDLYQRDRPLEAALHRPLEDQ